LLFFPELHGGFQMIDFDKLIGRVYEAGAVPDMWPDALQALSELVGGQGAMLFTARADRTRWLASPGFTEDMDAYFNGHHTENERTRRLMALQHPGFVTDLDVFKPDEIERQKVFQDFWFPRGYGWGVATVIPVPSGDTLVYHAERKRSDGPVPQELVDTLDRLRPHLARAALLSARLDLQRAQAMTQALAALGLPAAVLNGPGRLVASNDLFAPLVPGVVQDRTARLTLVDAAADKLFAEALALTRTNRIGPTSVSSVPIPAQDDRPPMVVHVLPVSGAAGDVFALSRTIIVVTPVVPRDVPAAKVIQGLFDLTPGEAKIAALIGAGEQPREAAAQLGIAEETARSFLKRVFAKTGVRRQAELVALLGGASLPDGGSRHSS
jgi:DNA-binding CsgD family transcriptional regulator